MSLGEGWRVGWVAADAREGSGCTGKMLRLNSQQALGMGCGWETEDALRGWMDNVHP